MKRAREHLQKDPVMATLIEKYGNDLFKWSRRKESDYLSHLLGIVIGQQLSTKVADSIYKRFVDLYDKKSFPDPQKIFKTRTAKLRGVGLSGAKTKYIKNICKAVLDNELDISKINKLTDEEVRESLIKIKGIGEWSVEMFLMFSLRRQDIFSIGDLGLRNAVAKLYKVDRNNIEKIKEISEKWSPYRTIACRYLWKHLDTKDI